MSFMKFRLQRLGDEEVDVDPHTIITFPRGIAPFEDCTRFKLFHEEGHPSVFWLQSLDAPELLFSLADPDSLHVSYEVSLDDEEQELLQLAAGDELLLAVILYRDESNGGGLQMNLRAPILLNTSKRTGMQKILDTLETDLTVRGR